MNKEKYIIGGILKTLKANYFLHIQEDSLQLNYKPWKASPYNEIKFGKEGLVFHNVVLSAGNQKLIVDNVNKQPSSIDLGFQNFKLATLGEIIQSDSSFVGGTLNGFVKYYREQRDTILTSDLKIKELAYLGKPVGDIALLAERKDGSKINVNFALSGNKNDLKIEGFYNAAAGAASPLNFDAKINSLNLASVAPFCVGPG